MIISDDGGETWTTSNTGLTGPYVRSLLTFGASICAGTDDHGVFVTDNSGKSRKSQTMGLPDSSQVFDMASSNGTLFAGLYSKGLYQWKPESKCWVKTGGVAPLQLATIDEALVVGHNSGGVYVTEDKGETWQDGNQGLPDNAPVWTLGANNSHVFVGPAGTARRGRPGMGQRLCTDPILTVQVLWGHETIV